MKKIITQEDINILLQAIYQTNPPIQAFNGIEKLLKELPVMPEVKTDEVVKVGEPTITSSKAVTE